MAPPNSPPQDPPSHTVLVGISGPSCSGKTTLARLLRDLFTQILGKERVVLVHEDDFYWDEDELPRTSTGLPDWDSPASLDLPRLISTLKHTKTHGRLPDDHRSLEDLQPVSTTPEISREVLKSVEKYIRDALDIKREDDETSETRLTLILIDGFLLFPPSVSTIRQLLHIKLFLPLSRTEVLRRRGGREGYVTSSSSSSITKNPSSTNPSLPHPDGPQGFWKDPPGYVEQVVWPRYVQEHGVLFEDSERCVGRVDEVVEREWGVRVFDEGEGEGEGDGDRKGKEGGNGGWEERVRWAVGEVVHELVRRRR
ncbi:MAG: ribosylnicotinamide kinase [Caeruleum heppii]|nr:MAG: ribosylnicotinamide kinase [Caeruleum heppii]